MPEGFRNWLLSFFGMIIGVLILHLVLHTFFSVEPSLRWIAALMGVWAGAVIVYVRQVRGREIARAADPLA